MQRSHLLGLLAALILAAVGIWFAFGSGGEPPPPAPVGTGAEVPVAPLTGIAEAVGGEGERIASRREARSAGAPDDPRDDPEIRAALTGFTGRVVDARRSPVADCGVRIYRGAMDSVMPQGGDYFAEPASYTPDYIAGEVKTGEDGRFLVDGVWPNGFYLLLAGIGTDAPTHRFLTRSPAPGEIVDLGDVVLQDAAVVTGTVVDEDGQPVAGALVRGVDLPGQMLGFFPLERFDPQGAVLIREPSAPVQVVEMPPWVEHAFEHLPIPTTHTGSDGTFRLVGLVPGSNVIATTKPGLLADLRQNVILRAGQTKALGTIRLRFGEELIGRVLDTAGKPVADAEILAGSTVLMAPVDLARRVGKSDGEGRFHAEGFSPGKITVAARRSEKDPWVLAEPQPVTGDVVVTLPGVASLIVRVTDSAGALVRDARLRLLPGVRDDEAAMMSLMGFSRPVEIETRRTTLDDGRVKLDGLPLGRYVLLATSERAAMGTAEVDLREGDKEVAVALPARVEFAVRVLGPDGKPLRSAAVYAQERGENRTRQVPFLAGRTDGEGRARIVDAGSNEVRVSAEHPAYGIVNGGCKLGEPELVLQMQVPGWIEGTLTERGRAPDPGKYSISAEWRPTVRGALEMVPKLIAPGLDGRFTLRALQPGRYRLMALNSLDALTSPGGVMNFAQGMFMGGGNFQSESVEVVSGQGSQVRLSIGDEEYTGPTGRVFGSVTIDGRLGRDCVITAWTQAGRRTAKVDEAGRYELGDVPVGRVNLSLVEPGDMMMFSRDGLAERSFELKQAEQHEENFVLQTASLAGYVTMPDGTPAANAPVEGGGRSLDQGGENGSSHRVMAVTDANGAFRIDRAPVGVYWLQVRTRGDTPMRGRVEDVRAEFGDVTGIQIRLERAPLVRGRIDVAAFASKPDGMWMSFHRDDPSRPDGFGEQVDGTGVRREGNFSTADLTPGSYRVRIHARIGDSWKQFTTTQPLVVPAAGANDVVLRPVAM